MERNDWRDKSRVQPFDQLDRGDVAATEFVADEGEADDDWCATHKKLSGGSAACPRLQPERLPKANRYQHHITNGLLLHGFQVRKISTSITRSSYDSHFNGKGLLCWLNSQSFADVLRRLRGFEPTRPLHRPEMAYCVDGLPSGDAPAGQLEEQPAGRRVRVAIVLPGLGVAGGSERAASLIANSWAERGWHVTIITLERTGTPAYHAIAPNVEIARLGLPPDRTVWFRAASSFADRVRLLRREFLRLSPDVVISFLTRTNVLSVLAALGTNIPVVVSERNNAEMQAFGPVWTVLRRYLYPRAFGLVTMTKGAMEQFPSEQRARSWVIPNEANLPTSLRKKSGQKILAAVGRLVPQKGFDLLLEAFAGISGSHPDWSLVIWGDGPERARLEAKRDELGLHGRVHLPGVTERPGLWIESAGVFVLSSRYEGWGIVLLEAMAAGLPVVSFDCRFGPREMITDEEDGLLVANGDINALSVALSRLLDDGSLRRRLGGAAAISARRFTHPRVMAGWDQVVQSALEYNKQ